MTMKGKWSALASLVFDYETPKIVSIKNVQIGILHRILQLAVIIYVLGFETIIS